MGAVRVVQVTNIAPQTTKDQMHTLFTFVGKIEQTVLYPIVREVAVAGRSLVCYVKFVDADTMNVALHMTNTVFIDRALIVAPHTSNDIPDEQKAFELIKPGPKFAPGVTNQVEGFPNQVIQTHDPRLIESMLPPYPPLPATTLSVALDEIRRTVVACNVDRSLGSQDIIDLFSKAGEVKYVRFAYRPGDSTNYVLVEFSDQTDIVAALKLNGTPFAGGVMQVYHSVQAIQKPQVKSDEAAQREIQEAMSRVNEAQSLINAAIDPVMALLKKEKKRSRSRSRGRYGRSRRSRSRSRSRRHRRSRSRHRRSRSRSHHRRHKSRSRSLSRKRSKRSRSRDKKKSRSRSRHRSQSRKDRSHSRSKRSRSRSKSSRSRKDDDKKKDKDKRDKEKRGRSKDREKSSRDKEVKAKTNDDKKAKKESSPEKEKSSERSKSRSKSPRKVSDHDDDKMEMDETRSGSED